MWPWRRQPRRTVQRSGADVREPTPARGTGDTGPAAASRRPDPPGWAGLPPIQRVVPDEPRLNMPDAFTGSLAAWRDPSYLSGLGHLVTGTEPAGVLHGATVPVTEPSRADPQHAGRSEPESDPLPLATPPAAGGPTGPVQRQVGGASEHRQAATGPLPERPVPARPWRPDGSDPGAVLPVNRLLTAPHPVVELRLSAVDQAAAPVRPAVDAGPAEPVDVPQVPTLGRDDPPGHDPAAGEPAGPAAAGPFTTAGPGPAVGPVAASGTGRPDLPLQRTSRDGPSPPRRLGLGEPLVSPLPPPSPAGPAYVPIAPPDPPVPRFEAAPDRAPASAGPDPVGWVQRVPAAGGTTPPVAAGTPAGTGFDGGPVDGGPVDGGDFAGTRDTSPAAGDRAGLVGELSVSRLAGDALGAGELVGPGAAEAADRRADGATTAGTAGQPGDLPLVSAAAGGPVPGGTGRPEATAVPPGRSARPDPGGPTPVQSFVPPDGGASTQALVAPLLAEPPRPTTGAGGEHERDAGDRGSGQAGPDLPVVSRPHTSSTPSNPDADHGDPWTVSAAPEVTARTGPEGLAGGGPPEPSVAVPPVVARLLGDRPARLLTGTAPDLPVPAGPSVQRISWQRAEAPAAPARPSQPGSVPAASAVDADPGTPVVPTGPGSFTRSSGPAGLADLAGPDGPVGLSELDGLAGRPGPAGLAGLAGPVGPVGPVGVAADAGPFGVAAAAGPVGFADSAGADRAALQTFVPPTGAAGGWPPPVQRWVGGLPRPAGPGTGRHGGEPPLMAFAGSADRPVGGTGIGPPDPVAQRIEPGEVPPPVDVAAPPGAVGQPPPEPASGGAPAAGGQPATPGPTPEPEELLKKLYDPLLRRLKTELRLDRERHGVLGGPG
ncbi:hypothetical protein [Micromonospora zhanjiangensis]|uniref:Syndecan 1 n=1 Tax=Micromonospora zhanjiangensis TaxID=1522057 RepID=A0ABV8KPZ2_9ACTN